MTRLQFSVATFAALATFSLFGCGGGGTPSSTGNANFSLLAGNGNATNLTTRVWKDISLKANTTYYTGSGADVTCPTDIPTKDGLDSISCDPDELTFIRSDGKIATGSATLPPSDTTWANADSFTVNGSDIFFTTTSSGQTSIKTSTGRIISREVVNGKQRIRVRAISSYLVNGDAFLQDVGSEVLIEEVAS